MVENLLDLAPPDIVPEGALAPGNAREIDLFRCYNCNEVIGHVDDWPSDPHKALPTPKLCYYCCYLEDGTFPHGKTPDDWPGLREINCGHCGAAYEVEYHDPSTQCPDCYEFNDHGSAEPPKVNQ